MKISKLLVLGMLLGALMLSTSALADISPPTCEGGGIQLILLRSPTSAHIGEEITYTIYVTIPTVTGQCDVDAITLRWLPPDQFPGGTFEDLIGGTSGNPAEDVLVGSSTTSFTRYYTVAEVDIQPDGNVKAYAEASGLVQDSEGPGSLSNDNDTRPVFIISTPDTTVGISALPEPPVCAGSTVTLTITETNNNVLYDSLTSPYVDLFADGSLMGVSPLDDSSSEFVGGDDNTNGILDPGEEWEWDVDVTPTATTLYTAIGHGTDPVSGDDVTWCDPQEDPPADTICDQDELAETTVTVVDAPTCSIGGPSPVCEDSTGLVYSGPAGMSVYTWSFTSGDATFASVTNQQNVTVDAGSSSFTLELYIEDGSGCSSTCDKVVTVNLNPECSIIEPLTAPDCPSTGNTLEVAASGGTGPYTYDWSIDGDIGWAITSDTDIVIITYDAGPSGCATFEVEVTDSAGCKTTCELRICCEGDTFCSFTQGFWGNAGGRACDPALTTTELLIGLLNAPGVSSPGLDPVIVGSGANTITFVTPQDVLDGLPAGGKPRALTCGNVTYSNLPANMLQKGRVKNVLVGQVVALELNLRMSPGCLPDETSGDLGGLTLEAEFCTVPYDDPEACPEKFESPISGITVDELLAQANRALGGVPATGDASIADIYTAVTAINEGFDECRIIVTCPESLEEWCAIEACQEIYDCD